MFPKLYPGGVRVSKETLKKKLLKVKDFRFFKDPERLKELLEKEMLSKYGNENGEKINFSEHEKEEKEALMSNGYPEWDRKEYSKFL